ncbi:hypothetical protein PGT21_013243 [Puccinia graminis f. sp. tritici]|uniref:Uncharacterized protein n=1 Tax=Puccinia graminis f. sp. tritici TaxID=56615 RepID=A0A5B0MMV0_PUCGR|nr:hypothetical protein PGT21_013243 [Puccinia graminis f. sp. tritici]
MMNFFTRSALIIWPYFHFLLAPPPLIPVKEEPVQDLSKGNGFSHMPHVHQNHPFRNGPSEQSSIPYPMDPMEISRGFPGTLNLLGHTAKRKSLSSVTDQHGFKTEGRAHIQDSRESQLNVKLSLGLPELGGSPHSSTLTASPTGQNKWQSQEDQIALDMLSNPIPTDDNGIRHAIPIDSVAHDPREASELYQPNLKKMKLDLSLRPYSPDREFSPVISHFSTGEKPGKNYLTLSAMGNSEQLCNKNTVENVHPPGPSVKKGIRFELEEGSGSNEFDLPKPHGVSKPISSTFNGPERWFGQFIQSH